MENEMKDQLEYMTGWKDAFKEVLEHIENKISNADL